MLTRPIVLSWFFTLILSMVMLSFVLVSMRKVVSALNLKKASGTLLCVVLICVKVVMSCVLLIGMLLTVMCLPQCSMRGEAQAFI